MAISNSSAAVPTIRVNALLRLVTWLPRLRSPIRYRSMRRHGTPSLPETALNRLDNSPAGLAEADAQRAEQPSLDAESTTASRVPRQTNWRIR